MANFYTKENISIKSLEDIVNRPNYVDTLLPRKSLISYVLAAYSFPRKIACCCVSNCYQNHKKGYLVRTTKGGECSICDSCAKRYMDPAALKPPKATRARSTTTASTRSRSPAAQTLTRQMSLDDFVNLSGRIKERVKELKEMPRGANWLYQSLNNFQKASPPDLLSALKELQAEKEESSILESLIENNASDQQLEDVEQLEGLDIFTGDIRQLLIEQVLKPLQALESKAKQAGSQQAISVPIDWTEQVDHNLGAAEKLIADARVFFTEENINRLKSIPLDDKAARAVRALRWDRDKEMVKGG
ncbi:hypothetical protein [Amphritea balenae]|uniref:Uncharacterized protein n=1 Tax=Amphritea balenae TaxID=452629 RepID=A0A3P1SWY9_9GAMM|nr:hypothetical protein [Amphritea balenae]RRD01629.1 hypothetical protein EHS89_03485 [Amphritea balenae]GGK55450.1 hypothetical protein GCM10007941_01920 [Amphritea balenae]